MAYPLLYRQTALLDYLTSAGAIFNETGAPSADPELAGLDPRLLALEARSSYGKRLKKIAGAFPRSFALLGADLQSTIREFIECSPPEHSGRLENASQFHQFLGSLARGSKPVGPPYLFEVASCELAIARSRVAGGEEGSHARLGDAANVTAIRRSPHASLLRCAFDIRPIFAEKPNQVPDRRDTRLAVAMPPGGRAPEVSEVGAVLFDFLSAADDWAAPALLQGSPAPVDLLRDLARHGLIEVRR